MTFTRQQAAASPVQACELRALGSLITDGPFSHYHIWNSRAVPTKKEKPQNADITGRGGITQLGAPALAGVLNGHTRSWRNLRGFPPHRFVTDLAVIGSQARSCTAAAAGDDFAVTCCFSNSCPREVARSYVNTFNQPNDGLTLRLISRTSFTARTLTTRPLTNWVRSTDLVVIWSRSGDTAVRRSYANPTPTPFATSGLMSVRGALC